MALVGYCNGKALLKIPSDFRHETIVLMIDFLVTFPLTLGEGGIFDRPGDKNITLKFVSNF